MKTICTAALLVLSLWLLPDGRAQNPAMEQSTSTGRDERKMKTTMKQRMKRDMQADTARKGRQLRSDSLRRGGATSVDTVRRR